MDISNSDKFSKKKEMISINLRNNQNNEKINEVSAVTYIISQNNKLNIENKKLNIEKTILQQNINSNEVVFKELTEAYVHLKGLLKNFNELKKLQTDISIYNEIIVKNINIDIKNFIYEIKYIRNICFIGYGIYFSIMFFQMTWITFIISNISLFPFIIYLYHLSTFTIISNDKILNNIYEKKKLITEIEKSMDFINEYIDSI